MTPRLSSKHLSAGAVVDDRFVIEQEVGSGGMGVVFRAIDQTDGAAVAMKVLLSAEAVDVERFEQEASILAQLHHPGVVRYLAYGVTSGVHYLVMEWLDGEDLAARLTRRSLSVQECVLLLRRAADALSAVHARGLVHRDLKPSNLFLVREDIASLKLLDFGIARRLGLSSQRRTETGALLGTPGYMAPEQIESSHQSDPRSDVFSLGCIAFECMAGRPAFEDTNLLALLSKVVLQETPRLREVREDIPELLDELVARMLAKDPEDRPQDASAITAELAELGELDGLTIAPMFHSTIPAEAAFKGEALRPRAPGRMAALTRSEQRLISLILAGSTDPSAPNIGLTMSSLSEFVESLGGRVNTFAGQWMLLTTSDAGNAVDWVERAARLALGLRARLPEVPFCLVTGRGLISVHVVEGEVIERGAHMLRATPPGAIQVDQATADMLSARFALGRDGDTIFLRGDPEPDAPRLLGKPTVCLGRARELSTLEGVFSGCAEEAVASAVLVTGPAGAGKSRLLTEFLGRLKQGGRAVEILYGQASSLASSTPFGVIAGAIRQAAGILEGQPGEVRQKKLLARLGRRLSGPALDGVAAFLGELTNTPFPAQEGDVALNAARADAMLMGDAMRAAWEDWIAAECAAQPVLLVLEDVHWCDVATLRLIDSTLRNFRDLPFMVLAIARPEVYTRFPDLWVERQLQTIRLGPLPRKASEMLVRAALGESVPDEVVARLLDRADGNPFYLEELIRAVAAGRENVLPDSVLSTVEAKRMLRAASIFGDRFSAGGVAALLGGERFREHVHTWLEALTAREIIAPVGASGLAGDIDYMFRHTLVREAAYAMLTESDRALGHRLAGAWLAQIGPADAFVVADHFNRGGEPLSAIPWYRRSAEQALEANDFDAALERVACGIEAGAQDEPLGQLFLIEAEARVWRGDMSLGEQRALQAMALLKPGTVPWYRALSQVIIASGKVGGFDRVERWAESARTTIPAEDAENAQAICLGWCAGYLTFGGRYAVADVLIAMMGNIGRLSVQAQALLHQARSVRASAAGEFVACLEGLKATLAAYEQSGDRRNACVTHVNLGVTLTELGDFAGAEAALRAALASADRMSLHDIATVAAHNLGRALAYSGRIDEGRSLELRAIDGFCELGDPRLEGCARAYLAQIEVLAGDLEAAERAAQSAVETLGAALPLRAMALATLARVLLAMGRDVDALAAAREAHAQLEALGELEEGESLVRLVFAQALARCGHAGDFAEAAAAARARLLERASRISDPSWRARFLADVPENAETLALSSLPGMARSGEQR